MIHDHVVRTAHGGDGVDVAGALGQAAIPRPDAKVADIARLLLEKTDADGHLSLVRRAGPGEPVGDLAACAARAPGGFAVVCEAPGTVLLLARPSGLGWRQSLGLGLALQPASGLTVLLTSATLGWPAGLPAPPAEPMQALLIALTLLQLSGPVWLQLGLRGVARESDARPD